MVIILQLARDVSPLQWEWEAAKMIVGPQSHHSRISPMPGCQHNMKQRFTNHFFSKVSSRSVLVCQQTFFKSYFSQHRVLMPPGVSPHRSEARHKKNEIGDCPC